METFEKKIKTCSGCKLKLPLTEFYKRTDTGGLKSKCKACECLYSRARNYKITLDQAQSLMNNNNCHCCGKEIIDKRSTYIDHCHETNKIRGILCMPCNSGIGLLGDNIEGVLKAVEYLTNNKHLKLKKNGEHY